MKVWWISMNDKFTKRIIDYISLIGTIAGLYQTYQAIEDQQWYNIIAIIVFMTAFFLILIFFHYKKKRYVDLYAICNSMSLNNRLQSLREMILIKHREITNNNNKYKIKSAKFYYILSQSRIDKSTYDIHYSISFKLCKTWLMRKSTRDRTFRFFAITLSTVPQNFTSEIITEDKMPVENYSTEIVCANKNYTTRGESGSNEKEYSGLYEFIAVIPQEIAKKKQIEIRFSYDILSQVKKAQNKHSFTIVPRNYSAHQIKKLEVRVQAKNIFIDNLEFQRYGINGEFEIAELFIPCEPTNLLCNPPIGKCVEAITQNVHEHYVSIKPDMNSAYSIQFDLSKQTEENSYV